MNVVAARRLELQSTKESTSFFEKKKKSKAKKDGDKKSPDTSKMPEGLRKHFEKRMASLMTKQEKAQQFREKTSCKKCGCKHRS